MNVALVLYPIWGAGGLATDAFHYKKILKEAGHDCRFFQVSYSKPDLEPKPSSFGVKADGPIYNDRSISIHDKFLDVTLRQLQAYDRIIFLHPCPHLTDKQKAVANWKSLYQRTRGAKAVRFTDIYLDRLYPWILDEDVVNTYQAWTTNQGQQNYVTKFLPDSKISTYPFAFKHHGTKFDKTIDVVWPNAWRSWKGIRPFVDAVPQIDGKVELYGSGRDLRQMRKEKNPIALGAHGAIPPPQMIKVLKSARISVDLTGQSKTYYGHYNRTIMESMWFGTISCVRKTMIEPYSHIPADCVLAIESNDTLAMQINELLGNPRKQKRIAKNAYEWIRENYKHEAVVEEIQNLAAS